NERKTRMVGQDTLEQPFEERYLKLQQVFIHAVERVPEPGGEVFLVAEQHVDLRHELPVDGSRRLHAPARLPQRRPVVEVVRDDRAVPARRLDSLERKLCRWLGKRAEHAARVEPTRTIRTEDAVPVDV